jgi:hypothetical protein
MSEPRQARRRPGCPSRSAALPIDDLLTRPNVEHGRPVAIFAEIVAGNRRHRRSPHRRCGRGGLQPSMRSQESESLPATVLEATGGLVGRGGLTLAVHASESSLIQALAWRSVAKPVTYCSGPVGHTMRTYQQEESLSGCGSMVGSRWLIGQLCHGVRPRGLEKGNAALRSAQ